MILPAANGPALPLRRAGNYTAEVVPGPRGAVAIYQFAFGNATRRRLLVLKLDHYGDFLIGLPALKKLRKIFPSDHITLVCGSWNVELARRVAVADEVRAYDFFPENGAMWSGQPFQSLERFREICRGSYDIALDLRVDEDTRFLLGHVEAARKCGIGLRARHPFLDIVLAPAFEHRESEGRWISVEPDRFESRMPLRTPFFHENDFSVTDRHLVYGPYLLLPKGRFRAHYGLRLLTALPRFSGVEIVIDVTRDAGSETIAATRVSWMHSGEPRGAASIDFANDDPGASYEFRIHARGRPLRARLQFFGVRLERIGGSSARFKPAELHTGEQLSLLVDLLEQRTRELYRADSIPGSIPGTPRSFDFSAIAGAQASKKRIVIAPLSNSAIRDWGMANYARLIALLLESMACHVVLVGAKTQRDQLELLVAQNERDRRIFNLAGVSDWFETAEIVRAADLVIANNSGVAHLAAACGAPTLAIYSGSHQPQEWGPRGDHVHAVMAPVPCSPCGHDKLERCPNDHLCMKQIAPETIADQAIAILAGVRRGTSSASASGMPR